MSQSDEHKNDIGSRLCVCANLVCSLISSFEDAAATLNNNLDVFWKAYESVSPKYPCGMLRTRLLGEARCIPFRHSTRLRPSRYGTVCFGTLWTTSGSGAPRYASRLLRFWDDSLEVHWGAPLARYSTGTACLKRALERTPRPQHTTRLVFAQLHDCYCDACVTSPCAQVLQPRDWLVGPLVRICRMSNLHYWSWTSITHLLWQNVKCAYASRGAQHLARTTAHEMKSHTTSDTPFKLDELQRVHPGAHPLKFFGLKGICRRTPGEHRWNTDELLSKSYPPRPLLVNREFIGVQRWFPGKKSGLKGFPVNTNENADEVLGTHYCALPQRTLPVELLACWRRHSRLSDFHRCSSAFGLIGWRKN